MRKVSFDRTEWTNDEGQLHREDGPAVEFHSGTKFWYQNGELHRLDNPAVEYENGDKKWYQNGELHRLDGPAAEYSYGAKHWYQNGQRHRLDGPAIELRASFQRLSVSTKDVTQSQKLLTLAIDISKGTGKELGTVVEALSKAYEGQDTRLVRLGIGITQADAKAMDFTQTTKALTNLYGGAAAANAETFQGRIDRLKQAFEEAKEEIGYRLLPFIERFVDLIVNQVVPKLQEFATYFDPIKQAIKDNDS